MNFTHLLRSALLAGATAAAALAGAGCNDPAPDPPLKGQVHLTLIHTSDIHSRLFPYNLQLGQIDAGLGLGSNGAVVNVGGAARVSYIVGRERARANRVLHLDGGDCFQGAPIFNYFSGEAEMRTQAAIGTDAMIVANHEFDRGALNLGKQIQQWADFPVLAANYQFEDPSQPGAAPLGSIVKPFTVFDLQGLKVAVVGMGNLSSLTSLFNMPNSLGITPLNSIETAQFYIDLLRPLVDLVVFVTHLGVDVDQYMIENTTGIDVVLGGHNHIVLQPPKRVQDCSAHTESDGKGGTRNFILLDDPNGGQTDDPTAPTPKIKRFCQPRDVILAHSGAFAKYVGRLDLVVSNDPADLVDRPHDKADGFEVITHEYHLFPVTENTPEDPIVSSLLEPYHQGLDSLANLDLLVGYALDGSKRNSTSGGDSALGNLIANAMWLRLGIQTDFSLTNSTGIRTNLVPGPVTIEEMFNIFPFDNAITKMNVSGVEVQDLFDFVARRSSGRGCVSQVQIAGARVVMNCTLTAGSGNLGPGKATNIYIGAFSPPACTSDAQCAKGPNPLGVAQVCDTVKKHCICQSDKDCPGGTAGQCDVEAGVCWQPIQPTASYELATSDYLAGGGSGFTVLKRNTTQNNSGVQQRDALVDYMRAGLACGTDAAAAKVACQVDHDCPAQHKCSAASGFCDPHVTCKHDADCGGLGDGFACACPEGVDEGEGVCKTSAAGCADGACVLAKCRDDLAAFQRGTCEASAIPSVIHSCEKALAPCSAGGEQCKFLACVDKRLGSFSDGRVRMVGQ